MHLLCFRRRAEGLELPVESWDWDNNFIPWVLSLAFEYESHWKCSIIMRVFMENQQNVSTRSWSRRRSRRNYQQYWYKQCKSPITSFVYICTFRFYFMASQRPFASMNKCYGIVRMPTFPSTELSIQHFVVASGES